MRVVINPKVIKNAHHVYQSLLETLLKVAPEELFKILESADVDTQELAKKIKYLL